MAAKNCTPKNFGVQITNQYRIQRILPGALFREQSRCACYQSYRDESVNALCTGLGILGSVILCGGPVSGYFFCGIIGAAPALTATEERITPAANADVIFLMIFMSVCPFFLLC